MIKIISGFSNAAGSTLALVNLCNQLNASKKPCVFYGPDSWHLDKCESGTLAEFSPAHNDTIIVNDIPLLSVDDLLNIQALTEENRKGGMFNSLIRSVKRFLPSTPPSKYKLYLTRLSNDALPLSSIQTSIFHKIHFASDTLPGYSRLSALSFIAPNLCGDLNKSWHQPEKIAGIIGSVKAQNNIELAIEQALLDGMNTVIIFGYMKEPKYYYEKIIPLTNKYPGKIKYAGFLDDRQKMYDAISDAYTSIDKPWSVVGRECAMTGTRFHAPTNSGIGEGMTNEQIYMVWKNELSL